MDKASAPFVRFPRFRVAPILFKVRSQILFNGSMCRLGIFEFDVVQLKHPKRAVRMPFAKMVQCYLDCICLISSQEPFADFVLKVSLFHPIFLGSAPTTDTLPVSRERICRWGDPSRRLLELYSLSETLRQLIQCVDKNFSIRERPRLVGKVNSRVDTVDDLIKRWLGWVILFKDRHQFSVHRSTIAICSGLDSLAHAFRQAQHELVLLGHWVVGNSALGHDLHQ